MIGRPTLTVVIAATDGPRAVARAVASLSGQGGGRIEIIVVASGFDPTDADASSAIDPPRPIVEPGGTGVPRLRRIGLEASRGRVVAFTEDSCLALPGWADAWASAFADPALVAASGLVERDDASALDRAVFLSEYAPFLPPIPTGPPSRLAGNNFAVVRESALRESGAEVHETALLAAIRRAGGAIATVDRAIVRHVRRFGVREAFRDRLRFGFEFGRLRSETGRGRLAGLIAGPAILAVQVVRLAGLARRNPRLLAGPAATLPLTLALLAAWSLGEWAGWVRGPIRATGRRRRGKAARSPARRPDRSGSSPANYRAGPPAA